MKKKVGRAVWIVLVLSVSIYYIWRLFALTPWYDELYTYYYFISRGPLYSAIHWPLPNNHFLYSVLSAVIDWFGSPLLGLRGVSLICAVANLIMLSFLAEKLLGKGYNILTVCVYASMELVNYLAVQGRGYTLAAACYLISLCCLYQICTLERAGKREYIVFSMSLTAGLYTLPSSLYWVLPTCIAGGFVLLFLKKKGVLLRLIGASVVAAINTFIIYSAVWMALGCNLMQDDISRDTYGKGHLEILFAEPLESWKNGFDFMRGSEWIQGGASLREMYVSFVPYWKVLFNCFYAHMAYFFFACIILTMLISIVCFIRWRQISHQDKFLSVYLTCTILLIPAIMIIQRVIPYDRVYSFTGIPATLAILFCIKKVLDFFRSETGGKILALLSVLGIVMLVCRLRHPYYNMEYGEREIQIFEALKQGGISGGEEFFLTDSYQELVLRFYYGEYREADNVEEADVMLVPLESLEDSDGVGWPIYYPRGYFDWEYIQREYDVIYENEGYRLYRRKQ